MLLCNIYLLALGTVCLLIAACAYGPSNSTYVVASYCESPGNCEDCPWFQIDFLKLRPTAGSFRSDDGGSSQVAIPATLREGN